MRRNDRNAWIALVLALITSVFAIGGVHRLAVVALAVLSAVALGMQLTSRRRLARWSPLLLLLGAATALTLLQIVPFPAAVLELLNPTAYELIMDGVRLSGEEPPRTLALSLDPPGTLFELVKLGSYTALAYVALRLAVSERMRVRIFTAVAGVIGVAAGIGLLHKLLEAQTLYGLYRPRYAAAEFLGPLLNRNHFASLLAVGTLVAGGLAMRARVPMAHRLAWGAVGVFCLIESLLIQSRGAAVGLALGLAVFAGVLLLQRWFQEQSRNARRPDLAKVTVPATIVVLCTLTMVVYFSAGGVGEQLAETRTTELAEPHSKYVAWRSSAELMEESPWVGVGRGAFEPAFTRVHSGSGFYTYSHLENEYLQAVVDWGIPGGLALALLVAWTGLSALRRWNGGALAAGGLGAVVAVGAHSVVDFGMELPGLAVPVILIFATLTYAPLVEMAPAELGRARLGRVAGVVLIGVAGLLLALPLGRTLHEDHNRLREADPSLTLELGREAMARHPVDYLSVASVAAARFRGGDVRAKYLLNHALSLHPTHPDLHRLAARMLLRSGNTSQALVEYQLALAGTTKPVEIIRELVQQFPQAERAVRAIPLDYPSPRQLARILIEEGRSDVALPYLTRLAAQNPDDLATLKVLAQVAAALRDQAAAELAARGIASLERTQEADLAYARVLRDRKKWAEAEKAARRALEKAGPAAVLIEAHLLLADIHVAVKNWTAARAQLSRMREQSELYILARRQIHTRLAEIEEALGNPRQAEWERQRARGP